MESKVFSWTVKSWPFIRGKLTCVVVADNVGCLAWTLWRDQAAAAGPVSQCLPL